MTDVRLVVADPGPGIGVTIGEPGGVAVTVTAVTRPVRLQLSVPGVQGPPGAAGPQGPTGPAGPGGGEGGGYDTHTQAVPALVWTITHRLGRRPAVSVEDVDGHEVDAGVYRPDNQTVIITLGAATAGRAHLS
jgi:hypothetical protein